MITYFYQTFNRNLKNLTKLNPEKVIVASIHFNVLNNFCCVPTVCMHLNNRPPNMFMNMWNVMKKLHANGTHIGLLVGGAGGAFTNMFRDQYTYQKCVHDLIELVHNKPFITEICLDVEELVTLNRLVHLVEDLRWNLENIKISFTPLPESLISDMNGMGGFPYRKLQSKIAINYYYVQSYSAETFTEDTYDKIQKKGYRNVSMGILINDNLNIDTLKKSLTKMNSCNNFYIWELGCKGADKVANILKVEETKKFLRSI